MRVGHDDTRVHIVGCTASILHDSYFRPYLNKAESGPVPARCNARQRIAIGPRLIPLCPRYFRLVYDLIRFTKNRERGRFRTNREIARNCVRIGESYRVLFRREYTYVYIYIYMCIFAPPLIPSMSMLNGS